MTIFDIGILGLALSMLGISLTALARADDSTFLKVVGIILMFTSSVIMLFCVICAALIWTDVIPQFMPLC